MKTIFSTTTKFLKVALVVALAFSMSNCSKDDDPAPVANPEVNPLADYITTAGFNQVTTNFINSGDYEFGLVFKPTVNGRITALVAKIPDVRLGMRVSIWNKTTSTLLRTETMDMATANTEITKVISSLDLVANTEYMITMNSNDWYRRSKTDNSVTTYPITAGDVQILSYRWLSGVAQVIPTNISNDYYAGDVSFKFQKS